MLPKHLSVTAIVMDRALLWAATDTVLSQQPLLWRHNDKTVIVSRNTRGRERDTWQRIDNANARRLLAGANGVSAGSSLARLRHRWWKVRSFLRGKFSAVDGTA